MSASAARRTSSPQPLTQSTSRASVRGATALDRDQERAVGDAAIAAGVVGGGVARRRQPAADEGDARIPLGAAAGGGAEGVGGDLGVVVEQQRVRRAALARGLQGQVVAAGVALVALRAQHLDAAAPVERRPVGGRCGCRPPAP